VNYYTCSATNAQANLLALQAACPRTGIEQMMGVPQVFKTAPANQQAKAIGVQDNTQLDWHNSTKVVHIALSEEESLASNTSRQDVS
jgi:hypothetical protein